MNLQKKRTQILLLAALLLVTFLLYQPGLNGNFILDDYANIVDNTKVQITRLGSNELGTVLDSGLASTLQRPLSMLTFGLNYFFSGMDPHAFKLTNLLIHLITAVGVYLLTRELAAASSQQFKQQALTCEYFALFVTACWALHPLNASTVLYVVQRMTQLSTLASVLSLYFYCRLRSSSFKSRLNAVAALVALGLLVLIGVLCKENAALTPLLMLTIEAFLYRFRRTTDGDRVFLLLLIVGGLVIPAIGTFVLLVVEPAQVIGDFSQRQFNMLERLLSQSRVLWSYIFWLLAPHSQAFTFFHDDYQISRSLLEPVTTLAAIAALLAVAIFTWRIRLRWPLAALGITFFFVGHAMESTIISLELVFEHRNYLPGLGIILAGAQALFSVSSKYVSQSASRAVSLSILAFLAYSCVIESRKWSNSFEHMRTVVDASPYSHRANYSLAMLYSLSAPLVEDSTESLERARQYYLTAAHLDPTAVRGHLGYILTQAELKEELDPAIVDEMVERLSTSQLMKDGFSEISSITECWYSGKCKFPMDTLVAMYNAIGRNERTNPIIIQGILDQVGTALIVNFNRPDDGKALLYLARSKREDVTIIDLKLIQLEIQSEDYDAANDLVQVALGKNSPQFKTQLEELLTLIGSLK